MECSEWLERFENNANQPPQILVFVFFGIFVILADIRAQFGAPWICPDIFFKNFQFQIVDQNQVDQTPEKFKNTQNGQKTRKRHKIHHSEYTYNAKKHKNSP